MGAAAGHDQRSPASHRSQRPGDLQAVPAGSGVSRERRRDKDPQSEQTLSICELCAECAIILGKGVSEVASTLSLPEVFLVIKRDQARRREQLRWDTQSRALASAAVWSKEAGRMLRQFDRSLAGKEKKPRQPAQQDLEAGYRRLGIPVVGQ